MGFLFGNLFSAVYFHAGLLYELRVEQNNGSFHLPLTGLLVRISEYAGGLMSHGWFRTDRDMNCADLPDDCVCGEYVLPDLDEIVRNCGPGGLVGTEHGGVLDTATVAAVVPSSTQETVWVESTFATTVMATDAAAIILEDDVADPRYQDPLDMTADAVVQKEHAVSAGGAGDEDRGVDRDAEPLLDHGAAGGGAALLNITVGENIFIFLFRHEVILYM